MTRSTLHRSAAEPIGQTPDAVSENTYPAPTMFDAEDLEALHAALIVGLGSMGEIRRVRETAEAHGREAELLEQGFLPLDCDPGDGINDFCFALQIVFRQYRELMRNPGAR